MPQQPVSRVAMEPPPRDDLIYDKEQALDYYLRFIKVGVASGWTISDNEVLPSHHSQAERRLRQRRNRDQAYSFFGGGMYMHIHVCFTGGICTYMYM